MFKHLWYAVGPPHPPFLAFRQTMHICCLERPAQQAQKRTGLYDMHIFMCRGHVKQEGHDKYVNHP